MQAVLTKDSSTPKRRFPAPIEAPLNVCSAAKVSVVRLEPKLYTDSRPDPPRITPLQPHNFQ